jgi:glycosyltransferase involved in cell wall biosynthesis
MKIVIVNSFFPPWRGGAESYTFNLGANLRRRGHEIVVFCGNEPLTPGFQVVEGIRIERLEILGRLYGTPIMPSLPGRLSRERADVLHANFPSPYIAFLTAVTAKWNTTPSILTWHNDLPSVTTIASLLAEAHDKLLLPVYLPRYDRIIATTEQYAATSRNLRRVREKVVIIPNGVDTVRFNPNVSGDEIKEKFRLRGRSVLLFVGALSQWHRYKGLDVLLSAMARLRKVNENVRLLVVGDGSLSNEYRALAKSLGASEEVIFAGDVSDDALPEYYACADILVVPSKDRSEGFGLTILEANASGKPVIGSNVGGIPGVIEDGENGRLVPANEPVMLAEAVGHLLSSDELRAKMGRAGRLLAEKHDWSIVAERTEELYESVRLT